MQAKRASITLAMLALVVAACGGGDSSSEVEATPPPAEKVETTPPAAEEAVTTPPAPDEVETTMPAEEVGATSLQLVGENISFDSTELSAPAGQEVTITFENRDSGVPHNLRVNGPSGPIATEIAGGPITQTLTFTIDEPGTYTFLCEVHPTQMVGELVIEG